MYLKAQLLTRRLRGQDVSDAVRADLECIMDEVHRLNRLLDEFRSFYRHDELNMAPTDIGPIVDEVLRLQSQGTNGEASSIRIDREVPSELPTIHA